MTILGYPIQALVLYFIFYSFLGWLMETCYCSIHERRLVDRGFLYGPVCPIYGAGVVLMILFFTPLTHNFLLFYVTAVVVMTSWEYFVAWLLETTTHVRYWDYSNRRFNLKGRVCLSIALTWGVLSYVVIFWIHPPVERLVLDIPLNIMEYAALILSIAAAVDFTQSFNEAMDMKHVLGRLEESKRQIRQMQERLKVSAEEVAEDYRKRSEEVRRTVSGQRSMLLAGIQERREIQKQLLEELAARADFLLKEELPSKVDELIGEERRKELSEIRDSIYREFQKMGERTDRHYLHAVSLLRRNPTAVSDRFKEAVEELRRMSEEGKQIPERKTDDENRDDSEDDNR